MINNLSLGEVVQLVVAVIVVVMLFQIPVAMILLRKIESVRTNQPALDFTEAVVEKLEKAASPELVHVIAGHTDQAFKLAQTLAAALGSDEMRALLGSARAVVKAVTDGLPNDIPVDPIMGSPEQVGAA